MTVTADMLTHTPSASIPLRSTNLKELAQGRSRFRVHATHTPPPLFASIDVSLAAVEQGRAPLSRHLSPSHGQPQRTSTGACVRCIHLMWVLRAGILLTSGRYLLIMHVIVFIVGYYITHHHACPKCAPLPKRMDPPLPPTV
jgi:hypothetical protein